MAASRRKQPTRIPSSFWLPWYSSDTFLVVHSWVIRMNYALYCLEPSLAFVLCDILELKTIVAEGVQKGIQRWIRVAQPQQRHVNFARKRLFPQNGFDDDEITVRLPTEEKRQQDGGGCLSSFDILEIHPFFFFSRFPDGGESHLIWYIDCFWQHYGKSRKKERRMLYSLV